MMKRLAAGAVAMVFVGFTFAAPSPTLATAAADRTASSQDTPPRGQAPSGMPGMKMHEQMMADMKAADSRLDALVSEMNAATGDARVDAIAAVVTELVRQQKAMHDRMGQMHQQMMTGMMMK